jgi:hypothetical protein
MEIESALNSLKARACFKIRSNLILDSKEKELWYAVLERAVRDIGKFSITRKKSKPVGIKRDIFNGDRFFVSNVYSEMFNEICEDLDTSPEYIIRILKDYKLIPFKREYYDRISEQLGI